MTNTYVPFEWSDLVLIEADVPSPNGRIYPTSELERAAADMQARINATGPIHGLLGVPDFAGPLGLSMTNVAFVIKECRFRDHRLTISAETINSPMGEELATLARSNEALAPDSPRSLKVTLLATGALINGTKPPIVEELSLISAAFYVEPDGNAA